MSEKLELRMYGLVPYNISEIQKGIQFGHAVVEYGQMITLSNEQLKKQYNEWADNWKTFIILNGGTSNHGNMDHHICRFGYDGGFGTMEKHQATLQENGISIAIFSEPDMNFMTSAIVFIVDERVFDKNKYPDFNFGVIQSDVLNPIFIDILQEKEYTKWINSIGGKKNLFLREFLKNFRLA